MDKTNDKRIVIYISNIKVELDAHVFLDMVEKVIKEGQEASLIESAKKVKEQKPDSPEAYIAEFLLFLYRRQAEGEVIPSLPIFDQTKQS